MHIIRHSFPTATASAILPLQNPPNSKLFRTPTGVSPPLSIMISPFRDAYLQFLYPVPLTIVPSTHRGSLLEHLPIPRKKDTGHHELARRYINHGQSPLGTTFLLTSFKNTISTGLFHLHSQSAIFYTLYPPNKNFRTMSPIAVIVSAAPAENENPVDQGRCMCLSFPSAF